MWHSQAMQDMQVLAYMIAEVHVTRSGRPLTLEPHTTPIHSHRCIKKITHFLAPPPHFTSQVATLMDKRVEIYGTSRADINGKRGVATDFHVTLGDPGGARYTVQLDSGEAFKLKPANVRAEGTGGGANGTGKAKKGKGGDRTRNAR